VLLLVPPERLTARASLAACVLAPETAKLIQAWQPVWDSGVTSPVTITIALVPVVTVALGLLVSVV
jgi:hypothetical protein